MPPRLAAEDGKASYKPKPPATIKVGIHKLAVILPAEQQGGEEEETGFPPNRHLGGEEDRRGHRH